MYMPRIYIINKPQRLRNSRRKFKSYNGFNSSDGLIRNVNSSNGIEDLSAI